jgi:hypothetical protein
MLVHVLSHTAVSHCKYRRKIDKMVEATRDVGCLNGQQVPINSIFRPDRNKGVIGI